VALAIWLEPVDIVAITILPGEKHGYLAQEIANSILFEFNWEVERVDL
jgi:hypothetical protein